MLRFQRFRGFLYVRTRFLHDLQFSCDHVWPGPFLPLLCDLAWINVWPFSSCFLSFPPQNRTIFHCVPRSNQIQTIVIVLFQHRNIIPKHLGSHIGIIDVFRNIPAKCMCTADRICRDRNIQSPTDFLQVTGNAVGSNGPVCWILGRKQERAVWKIHLIVIADLGQKMQ